MVKTEQLCNLHSMSSCKDLDKGGLHFLSDMKAIRQGRGWELP
jgi:hypothetical protein